MVQIPLLGTTEVEMFKYSMLKVVFMNGGRHNKETEDLNWQSKYFHKLHISHFNLSYLFHDSGLRYIEQVQKEMGTNKLFKKSLYVSLAIKVSP